MPSVALKIKDNMSDFSEVFIQWTGSNLEEIKSVQRSYADKRVKRKYQRFEIDIDANFTENNIGRWLVLGKYGMFCLDNEIVEKYWIQKEYFCEIVEDHPYKFRCVVYENKGICEVIEMLFSKNLLKNFSVGSWFYCLILPSEKVYIESI